MTDNRYFRTGEEGSFLREDQMEWLKKQIKHRNAEVKKDKGVQSR